MNKSITALILLLAFLSANAQPVIRFVTPSIVRVQWRPDGMTADNGTGVCIYKSNSKDETTKDIYCSSELIVQVNPKTGALTFIDARKGNVLLCENSTNPHEAEPVVQERIIYDDKSAHMEETANGKVTVKDIIRRDTIGTSTRFKVNFSMTSNNKSIYGLGSHMEDNMNLMDKTIYLTQHNLKAMVPVLVSPDGYGLLFDAGCAMKWENHSMQLEAAKELDYYFIKGETMDKVIAGYHYLTGNVSLMPRYVFGYTQSKERYVSSDELINTLREYRRRHVPIDMIVQDWNYWPEGWGYMKMNTKYYPDPKALADSIHSMNAKLMVSIWPNPQYCPEEKDFRERGFMLEHSVYDAFNPKARKHYWKYANDEFFSRGFDAWWCDSSEPLDDDWNQLPPPVNGKQYGWDDHARRWQLSKDILSDALGAERSSLYSLYHSMGIYENQRNTTSDKRVVNLTRSTYAGQQRYGTIVWNGDTHASWESFRQQIPAGLNYMATGNPYWTVDVGSFFTRNDGHRWFYTGDFQRGVNDDAYKEYYVRMFQWATFLPVLRSHGSDTPREIWRFGEPGTKYYDAILKMINLRYELITYIYSMAAHQSMESYTMGRLLAFDFANDENVLDIKDEYMFGDFLVCPVTSPDATSRKVYLPKHDGLWIDYWTGKTYEGGQTINASAPISYLPLFVKSGAIIPTTEVTEYSAAQKDKPVTINIYSGANADFTLYEDEGDNYNFENGNYSTISFSWNDKKHTLTVGERKGSFEGMQTERVFYIKVNGIEKSIIYKGNKTKIQL